ncbi:hypothetical protein V1387_00165, partial [Allomuricauda taeanensis]|uniref:hypothetical protein n=1 Tax=Flagellimonas taeanensis TaxID=1005926 RepID=UPI002E7B67FE
MTNRATKVHILPLSRKPFFVTSSDSPWRIVSRREWDGQYLRHAELVSASIIDKTYREILRSPFDCTQGPIPTTFM